MSIQKDAITKEELTPTDVLRGVLAKLEETNSAQKNPVVLNGPVTTEIADDSDWHRTRIGTMKYESFSVIMIGEKPWMVAVGTKSGDYPGDNQYLSDVIAIQLEVKKEDKMEETFRNEVINGSYFRNSLLIGTVPGYLGAVKSGVFGNKVLDAVSDDHTRLLVHGAEQDSELLNLDLTPIYKSSAAYKPEAIEVFTKAILTVLAKKI